ncbi:hypothetical protein BD779DRAFT_1472735 [Infundibulicybe gibba]|nr:hypothetical protein BD779DRAFT_1472735 [Infundibulicybe gibba]
MLVKKESGKLKPVQCRFSVNSKFVCGCILLGLSSYCRSIIQARLAIPDLPLLGKKWLRSNSSILLIWSIAWVDFPDQAAKPSTKDRATITLKPWYRWVWNVDLIKRIPLYIGHQPDGSGSIQPLRSQKCPRQMNTHGSLEAGVTRDANKRSRRVGGGGGLEAGIVVDINLVGLYPPRFETLGYSKPTDRGLFQNFPHGGEIGDARLYSSYACCCSPAPLSGL